MAGFNPDNKFPNKQEITFTKGQKVNVELEDGSMVEHEIVNVLDSSKVASIIGLNYKIKNPTPVLILDKKRIKGAASYSLESKVIFAYDNTSPEAMHHEIIHSLEMPKSIPQPLQSFYKKVLDEIPDNSNLNPNFRKDIHEFIADAYSQPGFIQNLKNRGLYQEFEQLTSYIFD